MYLIKCLRCDKPLYIRSTFISLRKQTYLYPYPWRDVHFVDQVPWLQSPTANAYKMITSVIDIEHNSRYQVS